MDDLINSTVASLMIYSLFNIGIYIGLWKNSVSDNPELKTRDHLTIASMQFPYAISDKLNQTIILGLSTLPVIKTGLEYLIE